MKSVWDWVKSAGVAVVSAISLLTFLPAVLAEEGNQTSTTTINWTIDPAPLINLVVALLPAILVIIIIRAVLGSLSGFTRLSRIHGVKVNWHKIAPLAVLCLLVAGFVTGVTPVAATDGTTTSSLNIDISGMVNLVMALLPLIIILVIMKALIQAFQGIAR